MKRNFTLDEEFWMDKYEDFFKSLKSFGLWPGRKVLIEEYESLREGDGDAFFAKYGVGNLVSGIDRPFERSKAYEILLFILKTYDADIYLKIHKGTPYYFIGWAAFQNWNFERAFFYLDAAVSEDLVMLEKMDIPNQTTPAIDFFLLKDNSPAVGLMSFHIELRGSVNKIIENYNKLSKSCLTEEAFINKFIKPILYGNKKSRSLLTSLYNFFIDYESNLRYIILRSSYGGTIEPLINSLFKGSRILESLLQLAGGKGNTLITKIKSLPKLRINSDLLEGNKNLKQAVMTYELMINQSTNFQDCAFITSYIIRNTTGHSLLWNDEFKKEDPYNILSQQLLNSILWSINHLW